MTTNADITAEIRTLEERLLDPAVRASRAALEQLLADDFIEIGMSGAKYTKASVITSLASGSGRPAAISDFSVRRLGGSHVLATFRSSRPDGSRAALRTSIWRSTDSGWQLTFHQGTPAAE